MAISVGKMMKNMVIRGFGVYSWANPFLAVFGVYAISEHISKMGIWANGVSIFSGYHQELLKIILRTLWWNEVESQLEQCTLVPCGLVHWSRKSKKLFASIRHRSNDHTFSNRMKTTYLIPFFPGLSVITHVSSMSTSKKKWLQRLQRLQQTPWHRDHQAMAEFLGSEAVLRIHSTDAATPREENRCVWSDLGEKTWKFKLLSG